MPSVFEAIRAIRERNSKVESVYRELFEEEQRGQRLQESENRQNEQDRGQPGIDQQPAQQQVPGNVQDNAVDAVPTPSRR